MSVASCVKLKFEELRSEVFGNITANFTLVGTIFQSPVRLIDISNSTNANLIISFDGVTDNLFIASNSFKLIDCSSNKSEQGGVLEISKGSGLYIKAEAGLPASGSIYVGVGYASPN